MNVIVLARLAMTEKRDATLANNLTKGGTWWLELLTHPSIYSLWALLRGATSRFAHLEKLSLNFSSSCFVIRVNLPCSFMVYYNSFVFYLSVNYFFQVFFNLKVMFFCTWRNNLKCRDWAPLAPFINQGFSYASEVTIATDPLILISIKWHFHVFVTLSQET